SLVLLDREPSGYRPFPPALSYGCAAPRGRRGAAPRSALDGAGEKTPHEVLLQGKEHDERDDDRDERAGGEQVPVLPAGPGHLGEAGGERLDRVVPAREGEADEEVVPHPEEL